MLGAGHTHNERQPLPKKLTIEIGKRDKGGEEKLSHRSK